MTFSVNYSLDYSAADAADYITNLISKSLSATEMGKFTVKVPKNTDVAAAPVVVTLTNLTPTRLIVIVPSGAATMQFNAEVDVRTVKELFLYDGTGITSLDFGNVSLTSDIYVNIYVYA